MLLIDFNNKLQAAILSILQEGRDIKTTTEYLHQGNFSDFRNHKFKSKNLQRYDQVFMEKHGFIPNLSIIDLLFNLGPESSDYLHKLDIRR